MIVTCIYIYIQPNKEQVEASELHVHFISTRENRKLHALFHRRLGPGKSLHNFTHARPRLILQRHYNLYYWTQIYCRLAKRGNSLCTREVLEIYRILRVKVVGKEIWPRSNVASSGHSVPPSPYRLYLWVKLNKFSTRSWRLLVMANW